MKISKRDVKILLIILGFAIILVAFLYGFQPLQESNEKVVQEITSLRAELSELQVLATKEDYYKTSTEDMETQANEIFDKFPADIKTEDCIMYAQELWTNTKSTIQSIAFTDNEKVYSWGQGIVNGTETATQSGTSETSENQAATTNTNSQSTTSGESTQGTETTATNQAATGNQANTTSENNKELFVNQMTIEYSSTYGQLKELINYIQSSKNRKTLRAMQVSYDTDSGNLTGSVEMAMYSLTGLNKVYEGPIVPSMTMGTDNIFGTVEVPSQTETQSKTTTEENTQN